MVTSSAVVGSSAINKRGLQASAIAITTRWRIPPDNSWGYCFNRRSGSGIRTSLINSSALADAADLERDACKRKPSVNWRSTVNTGFSAVIGS